MAIQNPNSSGQGFDPDHTSAPFYKEIMAFGYSYSHSVPVIYPDPRNLRDLENNTVPYNLSAAMPDYKGGPLRVIHHCFARAGHSVMVWRRPDVCEPSFRWSTSTRPGSGVHTTGVTGLDRHLRYKAKRYPELRLRATQYWLFELRDSDGNDCRVDDLIVEATTLEQARERAGDALVTIFPGSESDESWDTYHPCDCSCEHGASDETSLGVCEACAERWECSHGGASINGDDPTVQGYPTYDAAREAGSISHGRILVMADGSVR